jgi:hypothetical protein
MDGGSMQEKKTRSMEQKKLRRDLEGVAQAFKTVRGGPLDLPW